MKWTCGLIFGLGTHLLFAWTVYRLFPFLRTTAPGLLAYLSGRLGLPWYAVDGVLATQFAVSHSWLLAPTTRARLERWLPPALQGCLFCLVTCLSLLLTIELWQTHDWCLWRLRGTAALPVQGAFLASWLGLFYSLYLTGLGWQTGWTPWWAWVHGRPAPRRTFAPQGAYRWFRHPVYLSFLGLVWFTPRMSLDRVVLTGLWTLYILVGSHLKDRRLIFYLGDVYRSYQARVPGYPLLRFGPLGKVPHPAVRKDGAGQPPHRVAA
jgi:protein-S-isoprenylcysteine O-methyltransferase Ste14